MSDRLPIDDVLPALCAALAAHGRAVLMAPPGAGKTTRVPLALKVFLLDMDALVGLWRVLSFLGLGLALIALGAVYRRFVVRR